MREIEEGELGRRDQARRMRGMELEREWRKTVGESPDKRQNERHVESEDSLLEPPI